MGALSREGSWNPFTARWQAVTGAGDAATITIRSNSLAMKLGRIRLDVGFAGLDSNGDALARALRREVHAPVALDRALARETVALPLRSQV